MAMYRPTATLALAAALWFCQGPFAVLAETGSIYNSCPVKTLHSRVWGHGHTPGSSYRTAAIWVQVTNVSTQASMVLSNFSSVRFSTADWDQDIEGPAPAVPNSLEQTVLPGGTVRFSSRLCVANYRMVPSGPVDADDLRWRIWGQPVQRTLWEPKQVEFVEMARDKGNGGMDSMARVGVGNENPVATFGINKCATPFACPVPQPAPQGPQKLWIQITNHTDASWNVLTTMTINEFPYTQCTMQQAQAALAQFYDVDPNQVDMGPVVLTPGTTSAQLKLSYTIWSFCTVPPTQDGNRKVMTEETQQALQNGMNFARAYVMAQAKRVDNVHQPYRMKWREIQLYGSLARGFEAVLGAFRYANNNGHGKARVESHFGAAQTRFRHLSVHAGRELIDVRVPEMWYNTKDYVPSYQVVSTLSINVPREQDVTLLTDEVGQQTMLQSWINYVSIAAGQGGITRISRPVGRGAGAAIVPGGITVNVDFTALAADLTDANRMERELKAGMNNARRLNDVNDIANFKLDLDRFFNKKKLPLQINQAFPAGTTLTRILIPALPYPNQDSKLARWVPGAESDPESRFHLQPLMLVILLVCCMGIPGIAAAWLFTQKPRKKHQKPTNRGLNMERYEEPVYVRETVVQPTYPVTAPLLTMGTIPTTSMYAVPQQPSMYAVPPQPAVTYQQQPSYVQREQGTFMTTVPSQYSNYAQTYPR